MGAAAVDLVVDARLHGTQSLLAAGLARTQGAALCAHIPGFSPHPPPLSLPRAPLLRRGMRMLACPYVMFVVYLFFMTFLVSTRREGPQHPLPAVNVTSPESFSSCVPLHSVTSKPSYVGSHGSCCPLVCRGRSVGGRLHSAPHAIRSCATGSTRSCVPQSDRFDVRVYSHGRAHGTCR